VPQQYSGQNAPMARGNLANTVGDRSDGAPHP
jgi:hypothetical protein